MDPIRPVIAVPPAGAETPQLPERPVGPVEGGRLDPAVSVELSGEAAPDAPATTAETDENERRGFERDTETQALVYRISDALTGDVVVQIPDEVVIRARAYLRQPLPLPGERVAKSA